MGVHVHACACVVCGVCAVCVQYVCILILLGTSKNSHVYIYMPQLPCYVQHLP